MPDLLKRGDICLYVTAFGSRYIAVVEKDMLEGHELVHVAWYALDINEWLGVGSSFVKNLEYIGPMPKGVEWNVEW